MSGAAGEQCTIPGLTPELPNGHACRGGCGGRLHGLCGEMEDPDGPNPMHLICPACIGAKPSTKDALTAPAGKHKRGDKKGRGAGSSKCAKPGAEQATGQSASRVRVTLAQELEVLRLLDQGVTHMIANRYKWCSSYPEISSSFALLVKATEQHRNRDAAFYLQKARMAFIEARVSTQVKQAGIRDLF